MCSASASSFEVFIRRGERTICVCILGVDALVRSDPGNDWVHRRGDGAEESRRRGEEVAREEEEVKIARCGCSILTPGRREESAENRCATKKYPFAPKKLYFSEIAIFLGLLGI